MDFCNKPKTLVISLNIVSQIYCHSEIYIILGEVCTENKDNIYK